MNRKRMGILALIALLVSGGVTWLVYRALSTQFAPAEDTVKVVVANQKLLLGTKLNASDLRLVEWPRAASMEGSFSDVNHLVDRGLVATIFPNEPVLESKLAPPGAVAGLTSTIPEGMRAVAVRVNDVIGVAGFAVPGTRVDVILSGSPQANNETDTSKIFLENIQVLASGQDVEQDRDGQPQVVQVITLLVTPEDAQRLALASVDGMIQLALRNSLDLEAADPAAVELRSLYARRAPAAAPAPASPRRTVPRAAAVPTPPPPPPPAPPEPVVLTVDIFMGTEKQTVTYETMPNVQ